MQRGPSQYTYPVFLLFLLLRVGSACGDDGGVAQEDFVGEAVTVTGSVMEMHGRSGLSVGDPEGFVLADADPVLVVGEQGFFDPLAQGTLVEARGTVRAYDQELSSQFGPHLPDPDEFEFAVVADELKVVERPGTRDPGD